MQTQLNDIASYLDSLLEIHTYEDSSENGLQIETKQKDISEIALSVDAGESVFDQAISSGAQLLIVHHGLFWGGRASLQGVTARKVQKLFDNGCSLYAAHLPLDGHAKLGNAAQLATFLKGMTTDPFCNHRGRFIGAQTFFAPPRTLKEIVADLKRLPGASDEPLVLPFGRDVIGTAAIVTGSGSFAIAEASRARCDLLISGEPKQDAFHTAKELGMSVVFAGHYATETLGVQALGRVLEQQFAVQTLFIDQPTGI